MKKTKSGFDGKLRTIKKAYNTAKAAAAVQTRNMKRKTNAAKLLIEGTFGWPKDLRLQLIRLYGFDYELIKKILAFNQKLKRRRGQLLLVVETQIGSFEGCQTEILRPDLNRQGSRFAFYLGKIERELSFPKSSEDGLVMGDAEFFPAERMAWADSFTDGKVGPPNDCITFPSAHFMHALQGSDGMFDLDDTGKVKIFVGEKEIAEFEKSLGLSGYSTLHALKRLLNGEENGTGDPAHDG